MSLSLMCYVFDIVVSYKIKNSKYAKLLLNKRAYSYWTQGLWADLYVTNPWEDQLTPCPSTGQLVPQDSKYLLNSHCFQWFPRWVALGEGTNQKTVAKQSFRLDTVGIAFTVIPYNTGLTLRPPSRAEASERLTILLTSPLFIQPRSTPSVQTSMRAHFQKQ